MKVQHVHFNADREGMEPLLDIKLATLCGRVKKFADFDPTRPVCGTCFALHNDIIRAESVIHRAEGTRDTALAVQRTTDARLNGIIR